MVESDSNIMMPHATNISSEVKNILATPAEQPLHYMYLSKFRVDQCQLFVQHKCSQHKPYTCFNWHFMNQRRRKSVRKQDGTFNYNHDIYCTKYDESTGICSDGEECPFLHHTAGDTERRYHLRYYKTAMCSYDTDSRGFCVRNGQHCAFAHGMQDLRLPVYDIREIKLLEKKDSIDSNCNTLDKERSLASDDKRWEDSAFVLCNYKTEPCKKPPRLCRQGYACPQYHNSRDHRRSPKKFKYRSTPCPNVKQGDEWGDPLNCESGDNCQYCHTRTEQQFHPEIYKSTKCNDMLQNKFCPRNVFCAFAHIDEEMIISRSVGQLECTSLADFVNSALSSIQVKEEELSQSGGETDFIKQNNTLTCETATKTCVFNKPRVPHFSAPAGLDLTAPLLDLRQSPITPFGRIVGTGREEIMNHRFNSMETDILSQPLDKSKLPSREIFSRNHSSECSDYLIDELNFDEACNLWSCTEKDSEFETGILNGSSPVNIPMNSLRQHHTSGSILSPADSPHFSGDFLFSQLSGNAKLNEHNKSGSPIQSHYMNELKMLKRENAILRARLQAYEDNIEEMRNCQQAWEQSTENSASRFNSLMQFKDEMICSCDKAKKNILQNYLCVLRSAIGLEFLTSELLWMLKIQVQHDQEIIEKALLRAPNSHCCVCSVATYGRSFLPCYHTSLCKDCVQSHPSCPICSTPAR